MCKAYWWCKFFFFLLNNGWAENGKKIREEFNKLTKEKGI